MAGIADFLNGLKPEVWQNAGKAIGSAIGAASKPCDGQDPDGNPCTSKAPISCACGASMCLDHGLLRVPSPARPMPTPICPSCAADLWLGMEEGTDTADMKPEREPPERKKRKSR